MMELDAELVPLLAARFKVLGDPARLAILAVLQGGERSVSDIVGATGRRQPNVSQHLSDLARAGFVDSRRDGHRIFYRVVDPSVTRICSALCQSLAARARRDGKRLKALERGGSRPGTRAVRRVSGAGRRSGVPARAEKPRG